jgi:hypothetical protein
MRRTFPVTPVCSGYAVSVAVTEYDGKTVFGLNADRDSVPDLEVLQAGIEDAFAELGDLCVPVGKRDLVSEPGLPR